MYFIISKWERGQSKSNPTHNTVLTGILKIKIATKPAMGSRQQSSMVRACFLDIGITPIEIIPR
jgi:hypothetical protein